MKTDWGLIRSVMNAAIDVTVWEFLQSAWIMPENYSYMAVRARHALGDDKPYTPEQARVLHGTAMFCMELVGAQKLDERAAEINPHAPGQAKSLRELAGDLESWYANDFVQGIEKALEG